MYSKHYMALARAIKRRVIEANKPESKKELVRLAEDYANYLTICATKFDKDKFLHVCRGGDENTGKKAEVQIT